MRELAGRAENEGGLVGGEDSKIQCERYEVDKKAGWSKGG